jgi:hypothetical protein
MPRYTDDDPIGFWQRVNISTVDKCWEWKRARQPSGHGVLKFRGKDERAHRIAWLLSYGDIPPMTNGKRTVIRHMCNNAACCNPRHLLLGTQTDNVQDMVKSTGWGQAKLTKDQVEYIRDIYRSGRINIVTLAKEMCVHPSTIYSICAFRTWK